MMPSVYTSDYFEIIGDALEDLREDAISSTQEIVNIPKKQFMDFYDSLCQLEDRLKIRVASYSDVIYFLEKLEDKMSSYI